LPEIRSSSCWRRALAKHPGSTGRSGDNVVPAIQAFPAASNAIPAPLVAQLPLKRIDESSADPFAAIRVTNASPVTGAPIKRGGLQVAPVGTRGALALTGNCPLVNPVSTAEPALSTAMAAEVAEALPSSVE